MRFRTLLFLCFVGLLQLGCGGGGNTREARDSAQAFHNSLRQQDYDAIYTNASDRFQKVRSRAEYASMMKEIHDQYGNLLAAKEQSSGVTVSSETGSLNVFVFELDFEKAKAIERLTFIRDSSGRMRLWMFELS
jgi:hypothetical protein